MISTCTTQGGGREKLPRADDRERDRVGRGAVRVHGEERVRADEADDGAERRAHSQDEEGVRGQGRRPAQAALRGRERR